MAVLRKRIGKKFDSWILDYIDANKKRHRRVIGHTDTMTKKQAERIRIEREREKYYQREGIPIISKIPTNEFFDKFRSIKKRIITSRTMVTYESRIKFWEDIHLKKSSNFTPLNRIEIDEVVEKILLHPNTINNYITILKQIYQYAMELKLIHENPAKGIKLSYKEGSKITRFFSKAEISQIIELCNSFYSDLFQFLLYTGMRKNEVRFLEWNDIDFKEGIIRIRAKEGFSPKTKKGRNIPMHPIVKEILSNRSKESNLIFPSPTNDLFAPNTWWYYLRDRLRKLGIRNASVHTFRHTFASWLAMEGVEMRTIAELLGHSRIETTMIYAHLAPDHVKRAVERLPNLARNG